MSNHRHDEGGELHFDQTSHHGVGYEPRDLGIRGIIAFLTVLGVAGVVLCAVVWGYYDYQARNIANAPQATGPQMIANTPIRHVDPITTFPNPVLQPDPVSDLNKFRANEELILNSYGWVDQNTGIVHIPIEDAMQAIAKQGLPTRPAPPLQAAQFGSGTDTVPGMAGGTRPAQR